jgi:hypothetical protein
MFTFRSDFCGKAEEFEFNQFIIDTGTFDDLMPPLGYRATNLCLIPLTFPGENLEWLAGLLRFWLLFFSFRSQSVSVPR